ncbi:MAG: hypothetical protein WCI63_04050 [bacterium]
MEVKKHLENICLLDPNYELNYDEIMYLFRRFGFDIGIAKFCKHYQGLGGIDDEASRLKVGDFIILANDRDSILGRCPTRKASFGYYSIAYLAQIFERSPLDIMEIIQKSEIIGKIDECSGIYLVSHADVEAIESMIDQCERICSQASSPAETGPINNVIVTECNCSHQGEPLLGQKTNPVPEFVWTKPFTSLNEVIGFAQTIMLTVEYAISNGLDIEQELCRNGIIVDEPADETE